MKSRAAQIGVVAGMGALAVRHWREHSDAACGPQLLPLRGLIVEEQLWMALPAVQ